MEFRILGPLEVEKDGQPVAIGGTRQRALLAVLLLHANEVVPRDRLIEAVWGERPPETAQTALQVYISGLRKTLGADRITTRAPGYALQADPDSIDLGRFEALVRTGKEALAAADPSAASEQLAAALALWRGEPLADLDSAAVAYTERLRLEELRLGAIEERVEADLALGRHAGLIAELQALVREHPFRERLRAQLMVALYRSGRQAEALDVYRQGRHLLAEELGIEPGESLKLLERAILEHDPGLGAVVAAGLPESEPTERDDELPRRVEVRRLRMFGHPRLAAALAGVLLAGAAGGVALALTGGSPASITVVPNSVAVVDAKTNRLVGDVQVGRRPVSVAAGDGAIFVANAGDSTISRIDPKTRKVANVRGIGTDIHEIAVGFGSLWIANGNDGTLTRIDPSLNDPGATLRFGAGPEEPVFWVATGAGSVWATRGNTLLRINPATDQVEARVPIPPPAGLAADSRAIWVVTADQRLLRVAPEGKVRTLTVPLGSGVVAPTAGRRSLWLIVYRGPGQIWRVDPGSIGVSSTRTDKYPAVSAMTETGAYPLNLAVGDGAVWAVDVRGTVLRIGPRTAHVLARTATAPTARSALAIGSGDVWVAVQEPR